MNLAYAAELHESNEGRRAHGFVMSVQSAKSLTTVFSVSVVCVNICCAVTVSIVITCSAWDM